ncbi:MAG: hypothetical protein GY863_16620, partial [bacterium]|nr:hypothetical protein [bacterium]
MANIKIYKDICDILSAGKTGVLATILNTRGSTPAGSLSKMFVIDGGPEIAGTVGGGRIESDIITEAKSVFLNEKTVRKTYTMNEDDIEGGVICGGEIDVLIEFIKPDLLEIYTELYERCFAGADTIVGTAIDDDQISRKFLIDREFSIISGNKGIDIESIKPAGNIFEKDKVLVIDKNDQRFIFEPVRGLNSLIIFGGGHISKYLANIAGICDFNVTIVDDRS